jgi:hypothetical protein
MNAPNDHDPLCLCDTCSGLAVLPAETAWRTGRPRGRYMSVAVLPRTDDEPAVLLTAQPRHDLVAGSL